MEQFLSIDPTFSSATYMPQGQSLIVKHISTRNWGIFKNALKKQGLFVVQIYALNDGRIWVRHDEWHKSNWLIENGLAWEGPNGALGKVSHPATVPIGNNLFFISSGKYMSDGWREGSRTYILNMNVSYILFLPFSIRVLAN